MLAVIRNISYKVKNNIALLDKEKKDREEDKQLKNEYLELQEEIHITNRQIRDAYSNFNFVTDHDSISYYAYLIKALEMKYALLLKKAKQNKFGRS